MDTVALDKRAREILRANDRGGYTVPTDGLYPYQWNWDSGFAAWGFSIFDIERAWQEVETLMSGQWPNGMIPHILFHRADPGYFPGPDVWGADHGPIASSGISQPPVAASFVHAIWEKDPESSLDRMKALFPKLLASHRWFMDWRVDKGRVFITHPWEAGRDNAPDWDNAMAAIDPDGVGEYTRRDTSHVNPEMRPTKYDYDRYIWLVQRCRADGWDEAKMAANRAFAVADPTMTFILLRAHRDLMVMGQAIGADVSDISNWIAELEAGAASLWNDPLGSYDSVDLLTGTFSGVVTSASFLCWYAGIDDARMLERTKQDWENLPYPVPSTAQFHPVFDGQRYWRGPTWAILNCLISKGLHEMGHTRTAAFLREATADLIATHGFAEYFDPRNGAPAGGGSFTWTAAVWLAWASPSAEV